MFFPYCLRCKRVYYHYKWTKCDFFRFREIACVSLSAIRCVYLWWTAHFLNGDLQETHSPHKFCAKTRMPKSSIYCILDRQMCIKADVSKLKLFQFVRLLNYSHRMFGSHKMTVKHTYKPHSESDIHTNTPTQLSLHDLSSWLYNIPKQKTGIKRDFFIGQTWQKWHNLIKK